MLRILVFAPMVLLALAACLPLNVGGQERALLQRLLVRGQPSTIATDRARRPGGVGLPERPRCL